MIWFGIWREKIYVDFYGDGTYSSKIKMEASEVSFEQKNEAFLS